MGNTLIQDSDIKYFMRMSDSIPKMLEMRNILGNLYPRKAINQGIINELHKRAEDFNDWFYRHDKCTVKGHRFHVMSCYQSAYDNGADVPVQCSRCGDVDF